MNSTYGFGCDLSNGTDEVVRRVTEELKKEGFGVLTTIDVQATLKAKIGAETRPYVILGACNPNLAHRALRAEPELVSIIDPKQMMGMVQNAELETVASEAASKLHRVVDALQG